MYLKILIVTFILFCLTTCKKYDEGGLEYRTVTKLLGGNKPGCSKEWYLKKYIVDGIDSTGLIQGYSNNEPIIFKYQKKDVGIFIVITTRLYVYKGWMSYKTFDTGGVNNSVIDSLQCSNQICQRNIFKPELNSKISNITYEWFIKKLTNKELIVESNFISNHNYRIILKH